MKVGVLALQGDFAGHARVLNRLNVESIEVRRPGDLSGCRGLIIPGGESTAIVRLIDFIGLRRPLIEFAEKHPVFGTCAGLILMSGNVRDFSFSTLDLLDVEIERNAFGRQVASFEASVRLSNDFAGSDRFPAVFIRAPRIRACRPEVQILGRYQDEPVLVRQGHHLGASFHPELTDNFAIHDYFLRMVRTQGSSSS